MGFPFVQLLERRRPETQRGMEQYIPAEKRDKRSFHSDIVDTHLVPKSSVESSVVYPK